MRVMNNVEQLNKQENDKQGTGVSMLWKRKGEYNKSYDILSGSVRSLNPQQASNKSISIINIKVIDIYFFFFLFYFVRIFMHYDIMK